VGRIVPRASMQDRSKALRPGLHVVQATPVAAGGALKAVAIVANLVAQVECVGPDAHLHSRCP